MGEFIKTQETDRILFVGLDRGKSNAIHLEMIEELSNVLHEAKSKDTVDAIVLHGKEGFFSAGLDLITLFNYDKEKIKVFWTAFIDLIYTLAALPKPTVASITGHSPAGGCVLAICCDYRIMSEGDYIIGLNEVPVGIIVPSGIFELYSLWLGYATAYRSLLEGKLFSPAEALKIGLVNELAPIDRLQQIATNKAKHWTQFDRHAWGITKLNLRKNLLEKIAENKTEAIKQALEQWWRPSTRQILQTIIDNLTKKKE